MDSSKVPLGETSGPFLTYYDPGEIAAFALAINDDNPLYRDGRAVPPTFPVVPVFDAMRSLGQLPPEAMAGGLAQIMFPAPPGPPPGQQRRRRAHHQPQQQTDSMIAKDLLRF